jgi:glutamate synthase (ferredoxin)
MTYTKHSIYNKLEHRGAVSADGRTGDGAGILFDIHDFF